MKLEEEFRLFSLRTTVPAHPLDEKADKIRAVIDHPATGETEVEAVRNALERVEAKREALRPTRNADVTAKTWPLRLKIPVTLKTPVTPDVTARARSEAETLCLGCSKAFVPGRSDARYCSNACRQKAYRKRGK
jgi:hypothetical protein